MIVFTARARSARAGGGLVRERHIGATAALDEEIYDGTPERRGINIAQLVVHDVIELPREQPVDEWRPAVDHRVPEQRKATRTVVCGHAFQSSRSQPAARPA